jgi:radical SAM superfamily enzyme YgiQ (UPF0313 family)
MQMNIVLVNINLRPYMDKAYFPIGLAYVATAMEKAGYTFDIIDIEAYRYTDDELESLLKRKSYDVVAFGTLVSGYKFAKNVAAIARKSNKDALIIAGNSVAASIPEHLLTHTEVDIAVKGEGEITMCKLLKAVEAKTPFEDIKGIAIIKDGKFIDTGYEAPIDIKEIHYPNWELFDMKLYIEKSKIDVLAPYPIPIEQITAFVVNTARGCPFHCSFCYHNFWYTKYRYRTSESIIGEMALLQKRYGINYINFFDELTFFNIRQVTDFVDKLLASGLEVYWNADIRSDMFTSKDIDLLRKLKRAGCQSFGYSLESGSPEILKSMDKKLTVENFKEQKLALDEAGIKTITSIVLGYPEETLETLKQTFDVCYELNMYPSAGYLLPQPGTPMMEVARKRGFVNDLEDYLMKMGDRQDLRFNLTNIPDDVLTNAVANHLKRISDKLGLGFTAKKLLKTYSQVTSEMIRGNP